MTNRLNYMKAAPDAFKALLNLEMYFSQKSNLDRPLIHLLKLRASQINGCAYCVDMHTKEARKDGLSEQWIALVSVWQEAQVFSQKERALLAWTEAMTNLGESRAPEQDYRDMLKHFTEEEVTKLTVAIGTINIWNMLGVGFRSTHPIN